MADYNLSNPVPTGYMLSDRVRELEDANEKLKTQLKNAAAEGNRRYEQFSRACRERDEALAQRDHALEIALGNAEHWRKQYDESATQRVSVELYDEAVAERDQWEERFYSAADRVNELLGQVHKDQSDKAHVEWLELERKRLIKERDEARERLAAWKEQANSSSRNFTEAAERAAKAERERDAAQAEIERLNEKLRAGWRVNESAAIREVRAERDAWMRQCTEVGQRAEKLEDSCDTFRRERDEAREELRTIRFPDVRDWGKLKHLEKEVSALKKAWRIDKDALAVERAKNEGRVNARKNLLAWHAALEERAEKLAREGLMSATAGRLWMTAKIIGYILDDKDPKSYLGTLVEGDE
jgi:chromosome segregation ATPase